MSSIVYKRTSKGNEEIKKRTHKLNHVHRFLLIMVDGKASLDTIISRSSVQWQPERSLIELERKGFIENINSNSHFNSDLSQLKQDLVLVIQRHLPENNKRIINKILNSALKKTAIINAIDSSCVYIKLTVSEKIAKVLKIELHEIAKHSKEI